MRRFGPWELEAVPSGTFALDGGAMFGVVPRPAWSKRFVPDEQGRVRLAARCLLGRHDGGRVVLVDAGMGPRWVGRARATFAVDEAGGGLLEGLAARGVSPEDVTDVIATHLHFDHAGGLVRRGEAGGLLPTFPEALVHVQREHLEWARGPSPRDSASFRAADFLPLEAAGRLAVHDGPALPIDDLEVRISQGHTPAMQLPLFGGQGARERLFFPGDLIPTTAHVQLAWIMAYDNQPVVTAREKASLLEEAADAGWVLVADHDPEVAAFRVERRGQARFEVIPEELF